MTRRIKLTIKDTLAFYDDAVGDYTFKPRQRPDRRLLVRPSR
jgi:hypothetical protein